MGSRNIELMLRKEEEFYSRCSNPSGVLMSLFKSSLLQYREDSQESTKWKQQG